MPGVSQMGVDELGFELCPKDPLACTRPLNVYHGPLCREGLKGLGAGRLPQATHPGSWEQLGPHALEASDLALNPSAGGTKGPRQM